ncbi:MAG: AEC family transporter, partial [Campylobacter sp.]|nr:AEC family transporter [Campylobacter sp.]
MSFVPLFSIFTIIATGFCAKRFGLLRPKHSVIFVNFVLYFAIPALIFDKIYHVKIDTSLINTILTGFTSTAIGALIALGIGIFLKFTKATIVSMVMLSLFGNTLFVGMPVVQGFFGNEMLNEVIFYDQIATSIPLS